jgi:hypothetical protein
MKYKKWKITEVRPLVTGTVKFSSIADNELNPTHIMTAGYLGLITVIGSNAMTHDKLDALFTYMEQKGIKETELDRVMLQLDLVESMRQLLSRINPAIEPGKLSAPVVESMKQLTEDVLKFGMTMLADEIKFLSTALADIKSRFQLSLDKV